MVAGLALWWRLLENILRKNDILQSAISSDFQVIIKKIKVNEKFGNLLKHPIFAASQSIHNFFKNNSQ